MFNGLCVSGAKKMSDLSLLSTELASHNYYVITFYYYLH